MNKFEQVELEYSEEDILYYLVDEDDREIGFVVQEDGKEVEYYYEDVDVANLEMSSEDEKSSSEVDAPHDKASKKTSDKASHQTAQEKKEPTYLKKIATIAEHEGDKMRDKAEKKLDAAREQAKQKAEQAKESAEKADIGIGQDDIQEATVNLNALAKEGAEAAKELKEAYDEITDSLGWLLPKKKS